MLQDLLWGETLLLFQWDDNILEVVTGEDAFLYNQEDEDWHIPGQASLVHRQCATLGLCVTWVYNMTNIKRVATSSLTGCFKTERFMAVR